MGGTTTKTYLSGSNAPRKPSPGGGEGGGGGGGGPGGGGGSGGGGSGDRCNVVSSGTLRSPKPSIVSSLTVGQVLSVSAVTVGGVEVLQASTGSGLPVGVVDTPDEQTLLDCIAGGHSYQAEIKRISGGAIAVLITRI